MVIWSFCVLGTIRTTNARTKRMFHADYPLPKMSPPAPAPEFDCDPELVKDSHTRHVDDT